MVLELTVLAIGLILSFLAILTIIQLIVEKCCYVENIAAQPQLFNPLRWGEDFSSTVGNPKNAFRLVKEWIINQISISLNFNKNDLEYFLKSRGIFFVISTIKTIIKLMHKLGLVNGTLAFKHLLIMRKYLIISEVNGWEVFESLTNILVNHLNSLRRVSV
jgi:hypothetical protein